MAVGEKFAEFQFRGFHGDYEMTINLPDGQRVKREFTLNRGEARLNVALDIDSK